VLSGVDLRIELPADLPRGGFYVPPTLVAVLAPHHGKVYDPCCGSGGMFVQSEEFLEAHGGSRRDLGSKRGSKCL